MGKGQLEKGTWIPLFQQPRTIHRQTASRKHLQCNKLKCICVLAAIVEVLRHGIGSSYIRLESDWGNTSFNLFRFWLSNLLTDIKLPNGTVSVFIYLFVCLLMLWMIFILRQSADHHVCWTQPQDNTLCDSNVTNSKSHVRSFWKTLYLMVMPSVSGTSWSLITLTASPPQAHKRHYSTWVNTQRQHWHWNWENRCLVLVLMWILEFFWFSSKPNKWSKIFCHRIKKSQRHLILIISQFWLNMQLRCLAMMGQYCSSQKCCMFRSRFRSSLGVLRSPVSLTGPNDSCSGDYIGMVPILIYAEMAPFSSAWPSIEINPNTSAHWWCWQRASHARVNEDRRVNQLLLT